MPRPRKTALSTLFMITLSSVVMWSNHAMASQATTQTQAQATDGVMQKQLRALLLERKQLMDSSSDRAELLMTAGRMEFVEYAQLKKAALLAGINLCNTKQERIEIHMEVVKLSIQVSENVERMAESGRASSQEWHDAKLARLEAEIALLQERLK